MKRALTIFILLFSLTSLARADEASRRVKVTELLDLMHLDAMMDQMMTAMKAQVEQTIKANGDMDNMTPEQQKLMSEYEDRAMALALKSVGWKAIEPDVVTVYAQSFTDEEVDGMLTFYRSPVGQSVLKKMPQMTTVMIEIVQKKMVIVQPQIKALTDEYVQKMKATLPPKTSKGKS